MEYFKLGWVQVQKCWVQEAIALSLTETNNRIRILIWALTICTLFSKHNSWWAFLLSAKWFLFPAPPRFSSCTPTFFFLHPHNFKYFNINLDLFKRATGYRNPVIYSRFMNPELIKLCFLDEGVFRKVKDHKLLFSRVLNPEA